MTTFELVKKLCKERGISMAKLEESVGFGKNSIYSWKQNSPSSDKLQKVADYFNVSTDYLLGRTDKKYWELTEREKTDAAEEAEKLINGLESNVDLQFYGEPMSEEAKEKFAIALKMALEMSKQEAKRKFTRKDYRN